MDAVAYDLRGWRNAPFPPAVLRFSVDGSSVNLSDKTFALDVRAVAGEGAALISLDTAASDTANGVRVVEAALGRLRVQVDQATMQAAWDAAYAAGLMKAGESAPLVYDLIVFYPDGFSECWLEGAFIIEPGVTLQ